MDVFGALADEVRRDLVLHLATAGPARVVDLAGRHAISRPAISRHLRVLQEAGLCSAEDRGRERHYRFEPGGLSPLTTWLEVAHGTPRVPSTVLDALDLDALDLDALDLEVRRTARERRAAPGIAEGETG